MVHGQVRPAPVADRWTWESGRALGGLRFSVGVESLYVVNVELRARVSSVHESQRARGIRVRLGHKPELDLRGEWKRSRQTGRNLVSLPRTVGSRVSGDSRHTKFYF